MRLKLKNALKRIALADVALVAGIAALAVGVGWIYLPAGLITAGVCVIVLSVVSAR